MAHEQHNIAFYNLENLFDTIDDPDTLDDDFTPKGKKRWNERKYRKKLKKLGYVIARIGADKIGKPPAIIGVAEVENKKVIRDLIGSKHLKDLGYRYVHFNAPDERGIDTALLYRDAYFEPVNSTTHTVLIENFDGRRDYTRDILQVTGFLQGALVHILVNHWPSRRDGADITEYKRIATAKRNLEVVEQILADDPTANIVVMGDLNDNPESTSVKGHLVIPELYNPMTELLTYTRGSSTWNKQWFLFDQIIVSRSLLEDNNSGLKFEKADIFDPPFIKEYSGRFKGNPFRTFAGTKHLGGFSDHFPVFATLAIHKI
ncbi:MAG: endonuclease/exonuclease/phosphatase family protein [Gilvibacter sp.]